MSQGLTTLNSDLEYLWRIQCNKQGHIRAPVEHYDFDEYGSLFTVTFTPDMRGLNISLQVLW